MNNVQRLTLYSIVCVMHCTIASQESSMSKRTMIKAQHCLPCEGGVKPLSLQEIQETLPDFPGWSLKEEKPYTISRQFIFKDFVSAMEFVNVIAMIAEEEGHHPDMHIVYNKVTFELFTHAIQGLSLNDFIIADRIDDAYNEFIHE
ncbi:MAG: 4a-hydroxytetrahydrobiopterin dehydratase [Candidatus Babeliales bacterium]